VPPDANIPPAIEPPVAGAVPPKPSEAVPPKLALPPARLEQWIAVILSLGLALFLVEAVVSLVDDSLILGFDLHLLTLLRVVLFLFLLLLSILIYGLMALTPLIPKRWFLPTTLFKPIAGLLLVPCLIYCYGRLPLVAWAISLCQVGLGAALLYRIRGGFTFRWPLVSPPQLNLRRFSWANLCGFLLVNGLVLLPAVVIYFLGLAALAVDHFSDGFVALRPSGLTVQVRKYARPDGKTIQLVPMSHVGESEFYRTLSQSFPTNAIILVEGVSDDQNLLTNKISYHRMARTLGVAEQQEVFRPRGELVRADVDVAEFTSNTIAGLNLVMLVHSRGFNAQTLLQLAQFAPPHFEEQLLEDILHKRNRHLLARIQDQLAQSETIIVPWGAAHMPELAREIQKSGFRLQEKQDYVALRFGGKKTKPVRKSDDSRAPD